MREAVIVSTARTPIGKAYRGAFNNTEAPTLGGHAVKHAVKRAGLNPDEVEDVIFGCAMPELQYGTPNCTRRWTIGNHGWNDCRSTMFIRHDGNCTSCKNHIGQ